MGRGDLSKDEWARLKPHLPMNGRQGGRWTSHRRVVNGILYRARTGLPWRDPPARFGYDLTQHRPTQVTRELIDWADLVLAMDHAVLNRLRDIAGPDTVTEMRLYLDHDRDVPDPMGRPAAEFAACALLIEAGAALHLH